MWDAALDDWLVRFAHRKLPVIPGERGAQRALREVKGTQVAEKLSVLKK